MDIRLVREQRCAQLGNRVHIPQKLWDINTDSLVREQRCAQLGHRVHIPQTTLEYQWTSTQTH